MDIRPKSKPKFSYPALKNNPANFRFRPKISCDMKYENDEKTNVTVFARYELWCVFGDNKTDQLFASAQIFFTVIKDDSNDLEYQSETVFKCVKSVEKSFDEYLRARDIDIFSSVVKPVTLQQWMTIPPQNDRNRLN